MSVGVKAVVDAENAYAKQDAIEKILPPSVVDYVQLVERHIQAGSALIFLSCTVGRLELVVRCLPTLV